MYTRFLEPPKSAFLLFGPRGTGKSTWIRNNFLGAHVINLLPPEQTLTYKKNPSQLRAEVLALSRDRWVFVDEVQRVPELLDEVHYLMEEANHRKFGLTGSSARKLKHGAANLLAGRAKVRHLFPLNSADLEFAISVEQLIAYGCLPLSVTAENEREREDFLRSYVNVYLHEEVKSESLVRNIGSFSRFLEVSALLGGQKINLSNVALNAQITRDTARGYFSILEDTLIGSWLPAYRPRSKVKEVSHPKFYWFDSGVLFAAAGGFEQPLGRDVYGILFEHFIHHELKSYLAYSGTRGSLGYWATPSGSEVDFVWWYGSQVVAIEVKYSKSYRSDHKKGLLSFRSGTKARLIIVYLGEKELQVDDIEVMPVQTFLRKLHHGSILHTS